MSFRKGQHRPGIDTKDNDEHCLDGMHNQYKP